MKISVRELNRRKQEQIHIRDVSLKYNGNIIVIGTYKNNKTPIEYYCIRAEVL